MILVAAASAPPPCQSGTQGHWAPSTGSRLNAKPERVSGTSRDRASNHSELVAQGDSGSIGCCLVVDVVMKAETISDEVDAFTVCLLKAA